MRNAPSRRVCVPGTELHAVAKRRRGRVHVRAVLGACVGGAQHVAAPVLGAAHAAGGNSSPRHRLRGGVSARRRPPWGGRPGLAAGGSGGGWGAAPTAHWRLLPAGEGLYAELGCWHLHSCAAMLASMCASQVDAPAAAGWAALLYTQATQLVSSLPHRSSPRISTGARRCCCTSCCSGRSGRGPRATRAPVAASPPRSAWCPACGGCFAAAVL
jgi:hypothetical protein